MRKYIPILYLSMLLFLVACIKEIPIKPSDQDQALVINAICNTNEPIRVRLSQLVLMSSSGGSLITDAEVQLFENDQYIATLVDNGNGIYSSSVKPVSGRNYKITAKKEGFPDAIATESIPAKISLNNFTFKYIGKVYSDYVGDNIESVESTLTFTDPAAEKNYYELVFTTGSITGPTIPLSPSFFDNPIIANEADANYYPNSYFFSDELFNGTECKLNIKMSFIGGTSNGMLDPNDYHVSFRCVSYNYYMYRKIWTRHKYNQSSQIKFWEDIFKGEPIEMFTNIKGGYGIFATYTSEEAVGTFIP